MNLALGTGAWSALDGCGTRVLVVDDDEDTAELFARVLVDHDYVVETAHDGCAALLTAEQFVPAIALLDLGLPFMDGYEVAHRLREDLGDVRLVAVTAYGQRADRVRSRDAGFAAHLVKPVSIRDLLETLKEVRASLPVPVQTIERAIEHELALLAEHDLTRAEDGAPASRLGRDDRTRAGRH